MWSITLKDLKQMDEFLDPVKPLKLNQEEVNYLNRLQAGKKNSPEPDGVTSCKIHPYLLLSKVAKKSLESIWSQYLSLGIT